MVYISYKSNNNILSILFSSITFFLLITKSNCSLTSTEISNYNRTMTKYIQTIINYNGLSKKMEKITLNIFMKIRFKDLQKDYEDLQSEMLKLKENYKNSISISNNLNITDHKLKYFNTKYVNAINAYNRFEDTKAILLHMFKIFLIILFIIIFIVLILIGIGTYFVLKKQKYMELQEEISIRQNPTDSEKDKRTSIEENNNQIPYKSTQEDIRESNSVDNKQVVVESNNPPISKDYLDKKIRKDSPQNNKII